MSGAPSQKSELPIMGGIRYNAILNTKTVANIRRKQSQTSLYKGDTGAEHIFDANQFEIALSERSSVTRRNYTSYARPSTLVPVLTSLNGQGDEAKGRQHFLDTHRYEGLVATIGRLKDHGDTTADTFPIDMHGLNNIYNNGPQMLLRGQYVMWDVPENFDDAKKKANIQGKPHDRYTAFPRPYDPVLDCFSASSMAYRRGLLGENPKSLSQAEKRAREQYTDLGELVVQLMAFGAYVFESRRAGSSLDSKNPSEAATINGIINMFGLGRTGADPMVVEAANSILSYRRDEAFVKGGNVRDKPEFVFRTMEMNWMVGMAQALKKMDYDVKQRVFGKMLSTADRSQKGDIFLQMPPF